MALILPFGTKIVHVRYLGKLEVELQTVCAQERRLVQIPRQPEHSTVVSEKTLPQIHFNLQTECFTPEVALHSSRSVSLSFQ